MVVRKEEAGSGDLSPVLEHAFGRVRLVGVRFATLRRGASDVAQVAIEVISGLAISLRKVHRR